MDTMKLIIECELNNKGDNTNCPQKNKLNFYLNKIDFRSKKFLSFYWVVLISETTE